jgi:hypothetical protein
MIHRSDHPLVMDIIVRIRSHIAVYFEAIDMSIETSNDGVGLVQDALSLCGFLAQDRPLEHLLSFIDDMIGIADRAHQRAQNTMDKFRVARRGLFQVSTR